MLKPLSAIFIALVVFSGNVEAKTTKITFNSTQVQLLELGRSYGKKIGYQETIQAIVMVESTANVDGKPYIIGDTSLNFGKKSYGVAQVKLETAKFVLKHYNYPRKFETDEDILVALLMDNSFNIEISSLYFKYLIGEFKNWKMAVVAYNRGPHWVRQNTNQINNHPYLKKISNSLEKEIRPYNMRNGK